MKELVETGFRRLLTRGEGLVNDVAEKTIDEAEPGSANSKVLKALDREMGDGHYSMDDRFHSQSLEQ